jgi:hypothetical protein
MSLRRKSNMLLAFGLLFLVPASAFGQAYELDFTNPSLLGIVLWLAGLFTVIYLARSRSNFRWWRPVLLYPALTLALYFIVIFVVVILVKNNAFYLEILWPMKVGTITLATLLAAAGRHHEHSALATQENQPNQLRVSQWVRCAICNEHVARSEIAVHRETHTGGRSAREIGVVPHGAASDETTWKCTICSEQVLASQFRLHMEAHKAEQN